MTGHTPGPWAIVGRYGKYSDEIAGPDENAVAWVFTRKADPQSVTGVFPSPEGEANARLIAAAPDLLDALKRCIANDGRFITDEDLAAARAAIAKSEGRV